MVKTIHATIVHRIAIAASYKRKKKREKPVKTEKYLHLVKKEAKRVANFKISCTFATANREASPQGTLAEWLGNGLQNRLQQFESAGYLT